MENDEIVHQLTVLAKEAERFTQEVRLAWDEIAEEIPHFYNGLDEEYDGVTMYVNELTKAVEDFIVEVKYEINELEENK